jgi:act minimal PKS ketosynthase (KS/KS alpha)
MQHRVVITGLGPVTPLGCGREAFWNAAKSGRSAVTGLELLQAFPLPAGARSLLAAAVPDAELGGVGFGPQRLLAMCDLAFDLAWQDSGLGADYDPRLSALVVGSAVGGTSALERSFLHMDTAAMLLDVSKTPADLLAQMSFHSITHRLAMRLRPRGPVITVSTGCTAGLDAIGIGRDLIRNGTARIVVAGATDAPLTSVVFAAFDSIGALSQHNHEPSTASRPFDRDRDGFVLGEGACMVVLEDRAHALARGAHIYAEIRGYASNSNAFHMTDLPADAQLLAACIATCLKDAGLPAGRISMVNAHGSSTKQNDLCETNAIKKVLGAANAYRTPVNSLKSMIGHGLGASNAIEVAACALMLDRQFLLPTINYENSSAGCDLDYVPNRGRSAHVETVLKLSNGFSGIHSSMVLAHAAA